MDTRRNIIKKMLGAITASFAKPVIALPAANKLSSLGKLKGIPINIGRLSKNDWFNIFSTFNSSDVAEKYAQKAEKQLSSIKIDDSLAKAIVHYVSKDGYSFIDYVHEELLDKFPNSLDMDSDTVYQYIQQPLVRIAEIMKDPKYYSAGDIYFNNSFDEPRIIYSAEKMIDKGLFRGDKEIEKTVNTAIDNVIKAVKNEMLQKKKDKAYANSIKYSPADYLGGAPESGSEQHGYKLAVDHHSNDMKNLVALYEKVQQHH